MAISTGSGLRHTAETYLLTAATIPLPVAARPMKAYPRNEITMSCSSRIMPARSRGSAGGARQPQIRHASRYIDYRGTRG